MTAILQRPPNMDSPTVFGYSSNHLANLLPEPPSQPPPDSHGPPILSNNEVTQFNSHVEALTSPYTHTTNWKDPPQNIPALNHGMNSSAQVAIDALDDFIPQYHGMYEGYVPMSYNGNFYLGQQYGNGSGGSGGPGDTIAPHLIHNASGFGAQPHSMDVMLGPTHADDGRHQDIPDPKDFYHAIMTASHASYAAPFAHQELIPQDMAGANSVTSTQTQSSHQIPPMLEYSTDSAWMSQTYAAQAEVAQKVKTLADYGLEREYSAANTRRNSPERDFDPQQASSSSQKRKMVSEYPTTSSSDVPTMYDGQEPTVKKSKRSNSTRERSTTQDLSATANGSIGGKDAVHAKKDRTKAPVGEKKRRKKSDTRARLSESQKKENHKASEAKRRARIETSQKRLFALVPGIKNSLAFKKKLDETMNQILAVKEGNEALRQQLDKLLLT